MTRTAERRDLTCKACGKQFNSVADHGVWPKFCCRGCFLSQCTRPKEKPCAACGKHFLAKKSSHESDDGLKTYCSRACQSAGIKTGDTYECLNCGAPFYLSKSTVSQRGKPGCCSNKCRAAFYTGTRSPAFVVGHYTHTGQREKHLLIQLEGYISKYAGEHRIVAGREIGRLVKRGEYVIRVNRNPKDNNPGNLFICESNSEFCKRRNGSLPWPDKSNLQNYKAHQSNSKVKINAESP